MGKSLAEVMKERRSVRSFNSLKVPEGQLMELVSAASSAPSGAGNIWTS